MGFRVSCMTLRTLKLGNCGATACQGQAGILVSTVVSPLIACIILPYIIPLRSLDSSSLVGLLGECEGLSEMLSNFCSETWKSASKRRALMSTFSYKGLYAGHICKVLGSGAHSGGPSWEPLIPIPYRLSPCPPTFQS